MSLNKGLLWAHLHVGSCIAHPSNIIVHDSGLFDHVQNTHLVFSVGKGNSRNQWVQSDRGFTVLPQVQFIWKLEGWTIIFLSYEVSLSNALLYEVFLQINWLKIFDEHVTKLVSLLGLNGFHVLQHTEIFVTGFHHLGCHIIFLINSIVGNHHWNHDNILSLRWNIFVGIDKPLHSQIRCISSVEFASSETFWILEDHGQVVILNDLFKHRAIHIPALNRLLIRAATVNVTNTLEPLLEHIRQTVFVISEDKWSINSIMVMHVDGDKNVSERFVNWDQNNLFVLLQQVFNHIHTGLVNVKPLERVPEILWEPPIDHFNCYAANVGVELI